MGCGGSKESRTNDVELQARPAISGPVDPPGMIPRPRRDEEGVEFPSREYNLSERNISRGLAYVAEFLHARSKDITLVAVGGAVNTLLLRTRNSTRDVDFFSRELSASQLSLMRQACDYAQEKTSVPLGDQWLNNKTGTIGGTKEQIPQLVKEAVKQNDVVFHQPGLTVLAAPWGYAFVTKVGRITYGTGKSYDSDDAVAYLNQYIQRHGNSPLRVSQIRKWGQLYRRNTPDQILQQIDQRYHQQFGSHGIDFSR